MTKEQELIYLKERYNSALDSLSKSYIENKLLVSLLKETMIQINRYKDAYDLIDKLGYHENTIREQLNLMGKL